MNESFPRNHQSKVVSQLGKVSIAIQTSLFVVCLGCLSFLAFLWGASENNTIWRHIVLAGWTARAITITSLVLRWATAAQAAICTSMLAALLLQRGTVRLPEAAAVSLIRVNNTGPWSLLGKMKANWHRKSASLGLLTALLTLTALSLQFTSTILLSQVGLAFLPVASSIPKMHYGIKSEGDTYYAMPSAAPSFLDITPTRYPAFAEWTPNRTNFDTANQRGEVAPGKSPGIVDTGNVLRAFLPINNDQERSLVTEYHGFATVVDTRVVCMRPKLSNVVFSTGDGFRLTGFANVEQRPLGLVQRESEGGSKNFSVSFDCSFDAAAGGNYSEPDWALALCLGSFDNADQGIYSFMQSDQKKALGGSYLIINATVLENLGEVDDSDVWTSITRSTSYNSVRLQLTLCMTTFQAQRMEINATRTTPIHPEPSLLWDASKAKWNTKDIMQQLGAVVPEIPAAERGIFELAPRSWQWRKQPEYLDLTGDSAETTATLSTVGQGAIYDGMVNSAQFSLFSHIAMSTKNPALALQAFFTRLCSMCYYDRIAMFDAVGPSWQVSLVQVTRPLGWTAFIIVIDIAVLHLIIVLLVVLMFRGAGHHSRTENAWAAVSQLLGPLTESWIRDVDTLDDKTVKSLLKDRGLDNIMVGVECIQGRAHLVEKEKIS
ncbi:hypothetical protein FSPOR_4098 [Fusarium sporotrichioides]|uniref:Uncharacterized protein n=1 Tax=Fusarium sporotrichioides TaxID=5514 RepID=A0A395SCR3_FUSSP|nr:hypothetical protein FSPOR_4098 [Fusarium sporotrichioides]